MKKKEDKALLFWPYFIVNGFLLLIFLLLMSSCSSLPKTAKNKDATSGLEKIQIESLKKDLQSILGKTDNLSQYKMKKVAISLKESP